MMTHNQEALQKALWKIYHRPERPTLWEQGGNLPWNEPAFSERMLREHLDQSHGAASRTDAERASQINWLWKQLGLQPGHHLFDVTCGPGLYAVEFAHRGCTVTGVDFGPASIAYARDLALSEGVADRCTIIEQDVRQFDYPQAKFDAATFLYGQLAVFKPEEAKMLLSKISQSLKPGGKLCVELLNQDRVDKKNSTWWYTDDSGLWGNTPYLHLGERFWHEEEQTSSERFRIIELETGHLTEVLLCDQTYAVETMSTMMKEAGFSTVTVFPNWDSLPLYDADEWVTYLARK